MSKYRNTEILKYGQSGFSIVEVLITTFVFSIMSLIVAGNFVNILGLQRRGVAAQILQEESLFAIETMAREIRVSQITSSDDPNCNLTSLIINHPINGSTTYSASGGVISKTVGGSTFSITSSKISFSRLNFCVVGSGVDDKQPRIAVIASVKTAGGQDGLRFDIQTTISSRDVREEFLN